MEEGGFRVEEGRCRSGVGGEVLGAFGEEEGKLVRVDPASRYGDRSVSLSGTF